MQFYHANTQKYENIVNEALSVNLSNGDIHPEFIVYILTPHINSVGRTFKTEKADKKLSAFFVICSNSSNSR